MMFKGLEEQVVFSSVLLTGDWDPERKRRIGQANYWLRQWRQDEGFRYYDLSRPLRDRVYECQIECD